MTNQEKSEISDLTLVPADAETGSKLAEGCEYDGGFSLLSQQEAASRATLSRNVSSRKRHDFQDFTFG